MLNVFYSSCSFTSSSIPSVTDKHVLNDCVIVNSTEEILLVSYSVCGGLHILFIEHHAVIQLVYIEPRHIHCIKPQQ